MVTVFTHHPKLAFVCGQGGRHSPFCCKREKTELVGELHLQVWKDVNQGEMVSYSLVNCGKLRKMSGCLSLDKQNVPGGELPWAAQSDSCFWVRIPFICNAGCSTPVWKSHSSESLQIGLCGKERLWFGKYSTAFMRYF